MQAGIFVFNSYQQVKIKPCQVWPSYSYNQYLHSCSRLGTLVCTVRSPTALILSTTRPKLHRCFGSFHHTSTMLVIVLSMYVKRFYFQLWRYLSYSLVHSGLFHVSFNILVQVLSFIIIINVTININHRPLCHQDISLWSDPATHPPTSITFNVLIQIFVLIILTFWYTIITSS